MNPKQDDQGGLARQFPKREKAFWEKTSRMSRITGAMSRRLTGKVMIPAVNPGCVTLFPKPDESAVTNQRGP